MKTVGLRFPALIFFSLAAAVCLPAAPAGAADRTLVIKVAKANVRSGPGTGYPVVTGMDQGTRLKILEQSGDWFRIPLPREGFGWVYKEVVTIEEAGSSASASTGTASSQTQGSSSGSGGGLFDSLKKGFLGSRQSEMTAAAGSRGLGEEGGKEGGTADAGAVTKMEQYTVGADRIRRFISEGGLKPEKTP